MRWKMKRHQRHYCPTLWPSRVITIFSYDRYRTQSIPWGVCAYKFISYLYVNHYEFMKNPSLNALIGSWNTQYWDVALMHEQISYLIAASLMNTGTRDRQIIVIFNIFDSRWIFLTLDQMSSFPPLQHQKTQDMGWWGIYIIRIYTIHLPNTEVLRTTTQYKDSIFSCVILLG